jgi:hypothetical protein
MSSQASSAGHGEKEVRRKIVQTGHVDVMVAIRSGFFYTRTVPCELWFFDTGKPTERRDKVLMLDARNVHRKVSAHDLRLLPEQMANLSAIVWLYRGQKERFLALVKDYFAAVCRECDAIPPGVDAFESALAAPHEPLAAFAKVVGATKKLDQAAAAAFAAAMGALAAAADAYAKDRASLPAKSPRTARRTAGPFPPRTTSSTTPVKPSTPSPSVPAACPSKSSFSTSWPSGPPTLPRLWPAMSGSPSTMTAGPSPGCSRPTMPGARARSSSCGWRFTFTGRSPGSTSASRRPNSKPCRACASW